MGDSVNSSAARFAGSTAFCVGFPGACAPGFMLPPASQVQRPRTLRRLLAG